MIFLYIVVLVNLRGIFSGIIMVFFYYCKQKKFKEYFFNAREVHVNNIIIVKFVSKRILMFLL